MSTFVTEEQALAFINSVAKSPIAILDTFVLEALQINLMNRIRFVDIEETPNDVVILLNGNGTNTVFCSETPVVSISSIKIINLDGTKTSLTMNSFYPQVKYDSFTGMIQMTHGEKNGSLFVNPFGTVFPDRLKSVEVTGVFGINGQRPLLQYILLLMVLKHYSLKYPDKIAVDLAEEKIGNYQYKIRGSGLSDNNQILTLDSYIESLIKNLPVPVSEMIASI